MLLDIHDQSELHADAEVVHCCKGLCIGQLSSVEGLERVLLGFMLAGPEMRGKYTIYADAGRNSIIIGYADHMQQ